MTTPPPTGPLVTAGVELTSTIVVIDTPLVAAVALGLGVLAVTLLVRALCARRRRRQGVGSPAVAPQVAVACAALGERR